MTRSSNVSRETHPKYNDVFKFFDLKGAQFSEPYNFPLYLAKNEVPRKLIPFDKIFQAKEKDFDAHVHFFLPDVCFERLWKNPNKYIKQLKKFSGCIAPDFSLCYDFPYPLQLYNCYRNRVLGYILSTNKIPVIMNVSFAGPRTYDFCCNGVQTGGVIATGSLGTIKRKEDRILFKQGLHTITSKLNPSDLIIYGSVSDDISEYCSAKGIKLHIFNPIWDSSFITKEASNGQR
jgi:hypothetical protein